MPRTTARRLTSLAGVLIALTIAACSTDPLAPEQRSRLKPIAPRFDGETPPDTTKRGDVINPHV